jgi:hypothetical protein
MSQSYRQIPNTGPYIWPSGNWKLADFRYKREMKITEISEIGKNGKSEVVISIHFPALLLSVFHLHVSPFCFAPRQGAQRQ